MAHERAWEEDMEATNMKKSLREFYYRDDKKNRKVVGRKLDIKGNILL